MGYLAGAAARLRLADRKALVFETGMQNAGLAVAIIGSQFSADAGMLVVAALWAVWHNTSGLALAQIMRMRTKRNLVSQST
jgi:BASS family bile acid:Na+ symporter